MSTAWLMSCQFLTYKSHVESQRLGEHWTTLQEVQCLSALSVYVLKHLSNICRLRLWHIQWHWFKVPLVPESIHLNGIGGHILTRCNNYDFIGFKHLRRHQNSGRIEDDETEWKPHYLRTFVGLKIVQAGLPRFGGSCSAKTPGCLRQRGVCMEWNGIWN